VTWHQIPGTICEMGNELRSAEVYFGPKETVVLPVHKLRSGLAVSGTPAIRISADASAEQVGRAAVTALEGNLFDQPDLGQADQNRMLKEIARMWGYSSWRRFEADSTCCGVHSDGRIVIFEPMSRCAEGGYEQGEGDERLECALDPIVIGRHLVELKAKLR
jgi:hypothetical protein